MPQVNILYKLEIIDYPFMKYPLINFTFTEMISQTSCQCNTSKAPNSSMARSLSMSLSSAYFSQQAPTTSIYLHFRQKLSSSSNSSNSNWQHSSFYPQDRRQGRCPFLLEARKGNIQTVKNTSTSWSRLQQQTKELKIQL